MTFSAFQFRLRMGVVLIALPLLMGACQPSQEQQMETFALSVFDAVKQQDVEAFLSHFGTIEEVEHLFAALPMTDEDRASNLKSSRKKMERLPEKAQKSYDRMLEQIAAADLDLNRLPTPELEYRLSSFHRQLSADIFLVFRSDGLKYSFKLDDCAWTGERWALFDDPHWKGP